MLPNTPLALIVMLLLPVSRPPENPWPAKLAAAMEEARAAGTVAAYRSALDAAWRADDWSAGLELAREAQNRQPHADELLGYIARALWRAGHVVAAEQLLADLRPYPAEPVTLGLLTTVNLARGDDSAALQAAAQLESLGRPSAEDLFHIIAARVARNQLDGLSELLRQARRLASAENGYPDIYLERQLEGLPEFYEAIGPVPFNQIVRHGSASMPVIGLINLPGVDVFINGRGPYRMIVDTGGSVLVSLDEQVAADLGVQSIATATVHGVGGQQETGQVLLDELSVGSITCRRVLGRTFTVRESIAYAADGILGTGVFSDGRMTLDFLHGRLTVAPSSDQPAAGAEVDVRIVGDGKLLVPITVQGQPAIALLDSGADAFAVSPSRLRRLFPHSRFTTLSALTLGVGQEENPSLSLTPGVSFEFGGKRYENYGGLGLDVLDTLLSPLLGLQTDVLIGMPVLREMESLTVDFKRCKMWVQWLPQQ